MIVADSNTSVLEARDLALAYDGAHPVIEHLDLRVARGEILGITGVSGCGKTTLMRAVAGLLAPVAGDLQLSDVAKAPAYSPQEDVLIPYRTVWENAVLLLESPRARHLTKAGALDAVAARLNAVGLLRTVESFPTELSGGMRQRLQLVQVLAVPAQLVLLDEPFSQQDRDRQLDLEGMLFGTLRDSGAAAVVVSHDVDALSALCDRSIFLGGWPARAVVSIDTPSDLKTLTGRRRRENARFAAHASRLWDARARAALT